MATNLLTPKGKGKARRACEDSSVPRSIRFSFEENKILVSKVCEYFHSIIGPAANETPQRKKNEIWKKIVDAVNEVGGNNRPDMVVKKRYFDVKRQLKKKLCKAASHLAGSEDDKPEDVELTSYEEELLDVLMPRNGTSVAGIVDAQTPRFAGTPTSVSEKNVLRRNITDAIRAVDGNNRIARKRYFLAKRQLKAKLSMALSHSGQTGSDKPEDEDLTSDEEELLEALGLDIVTGVDGSVDTDRQAFLQEQTCALHQAEEERISSGPPVSPQDQEPEQMSGPMKSMDSTRYLYKASPSGESHQLQPPDEPSGSSRTHRLNKSLHSNAQEEIISVIVGSEDGPSTSSASGAQSSTVSSSSSGKLDAAVAVLADKTTEQLSKISELILSQTNMKTTQHSEIMEALHGIRSDLSELRHQSQISNEVKNQKRLDSKLFRSQLLQLKREKLDILRLKYGLGVPSSSKPMHEQQQEETSVKEEEFPSPQIKKMRKEKERIILFF